MDLETELGAWIGLVGGILWSVGAGLFAEIEGDNDRTLDHGQTAHTGR